MVSLQEIRKTRGLTQSQLAAAVGSSRDTIARAERGHEPRVRVIRALAEFLELSVSDVLAAIEAGTKMPSHRENGRGRDPSEAADEQRQPN